MSYTNNQYFQDSNAFERTEASTAPSSGGIPQENSITITHTHTNFGPKKYTPNEVPRDAADLGFKTGQKHEVLSRSDVP